MRSIHFRWKRWAAWIAGLLAAYAALGFWLVPAVVEHQLPRFAQDDLARQASIGEVRFNPFSLRLEAADLRLAEADGSPLFALGKLAVQLQWRSLIRRAWTFSEIRITAPHASLVVAPDGQFNLAQLLETFQRQPQQQSPDGGLPRLVIERFQLEQGLIDLQDRRAGYADRFTPIDFELNHFSTLPEQNDSHTLSAQSTSGGTLRWRGTATVSPMRASGEVTLENVPLRELGVYLKPFTRATVAAGNISAALPYAVSYADGKFEAALADATLSLREFALSHAGEGDAFAALGRLDVSGVNADLSSREVTVGELRADGGKFRLKRDAKGVLDVAHLIPAEPAAAAAPEPTTQAAAAWKLTVKQVLVDQLSLSATDETASPPVRLDVGNARLQLRVDAAQAADKGFQFTLADAALSLADLAISSGKSAPLRISQLGFTEGSFDLAARRAGVGRLFAQDGELQLSRDRKGQVDILALLPGPGPGPSASPAPAVPSSVGPPWVATARRVELSRFGAQLTDQASGIKVHVRDFAAQLDGASSDLKRPVTFRAGLNLVEGGQLSAQGSMVPAEGALQAEVRLQRLALAPLQPLLAQHLKLKIAGGSASAQGRLTTGAGTARSPTLRYAGAFNVAGLTLNEEDGQLFAAWKNASADKLTASIGPNLLETQELRIVEPDARLIIEDDRSFNAARLLVSQPADANAAARAAAPTPAAEDPFPVRIRRLRLQNAKLDFTDLSLRPQFAAKVYELSGVVNGLSSSRNARSQIELDGRVDEFGLARVRGELNPFAASNNTDVNVVFKNVDMVPASPYTMKFAGYRIAEGKISLDLQYKIRDGQLAGTNQIVMDKLTLGERVDSPDALKLPLELAIAILKDSNGRIDLGLPVSGNLNDPQFSYGAVILKAVGALLTRIVTAPFRALGAMLGVSGEKLEAIEFDPGSDRLLPPEREKLKQVAQILASRTQLKLSVPGQYSEAADGAALRQRAVRTAVAARAGLKLQPGEEPGPLDLGDRAVRGALRDLYEERFGEAELDKQKKAAEGAAAAPAAAASQARPDAARSIPLWQRVGKMIQGEPQVADASAFYNALQQRLNQNQPLAPDALTRLGAQRADAVVAALVASGVEPQRAATAAPEKTDAGVGKPVSVKLGLGR